MTFGHLFTQWLIATIAFGVLAFLSTTLAPARTLWPFGISFLYIGVLFLLIGRAIIDSKAKE